MRPSAAGEWRANSGWSSNIDPGSHSRATHPAHVVAPRPLGGHEPGHLRVGVERPRPARPSGASRPGVGWQVRQPAADGGDASSSVATPRSIWPVSRAWTSTPPTSSKLDDLAGGDLEHPGRGDGQAGAADHHDEVGQAERNDEPPKLLAHDRGRHGHPAAAGGGGAEPLAASEIPSEPMMSGMRPPPVWPKWTIGMPVSSGRFVEARSLAAADHRRRALPHRDVVAEHDDLAAVDGGVAADLAVAGRRRAVLGPQRAAERAELLEGAGVDEGVDALADR